MINRAKAPALKENILFKLREINKTELNNGLRLYSVVKKDLPIIQINFIFDAGSKYDYKNKSGVSNLLSHLIDEGAGELNALELSDEFEKLGIIFITGSDHDNMLLSIVTLKEHFDRAVELVSFIIKNPWLKQEDFEREKFKISAKIMQSSAKANYLANILFEKSLYYNTIYENPIYGYSRSLEKITLDDVKKFYGETLSPRSLNIVAVGNFSTEELTATVKNHLGEWNPETERTNRNINFAPLKRKLLIIDKPGSAQTEIRIGHLSSGKTAPDHLAKMVANNILGGSFTSRLNSNLREGKGYTYGIRSSIYFNKSIGLFDVSTSVDTVNTFNAVVEILKEIENLRGNIKNEEIDYTKSYLSRRFPLMFETYLQISRSIGNLLEFNLPLDYYNSYLDRLNSLDYEEIQGASEIHFRPDDLNIVLVGDKKTLEKDLTKLSDYEILETDENINF